MTTQYKKFTRLIAKWPVDNSKAESALKVMVKPCDAFKNTSLSICYTALRSSKAISHLKDLGKFIRDKVKAAFETNNKNNLDTEFCNRQYVSLNKLADNHYKNKYKRTSTSTATGLSTEECNVILSTEVLDYLKEENKGFFRKIFNK